MQAEIRRRTDFDPMQVYTERTKANDRLEKDFEACLNGSQQYISVGVSGQYVMLRLNTMGRFSRTCRIDVIMADPRLLSGNVFGKIQETKRRMTVVINKLIDLSINNELNIEMFFSQTIPALRIDILSNETFMYAYDDFHKAGGDYPDAAQFARGTQWDRTCRQIAQDAMDMACMGWRRGDGAYRIAERAKKPLSENVEVKEQVKALLLALELPLLEQEEIDEAVGSLMEKMQNPS